MTATRDSDQREEAQSSLPMVPCPRCHREVAAPLLARVPVPPIATDLAANAGSWRSVEGACPRCLLEAIDRRLASEDQPEDVDPRPTKDSADPFLHAIAPRTRIAADPIAHGGGLGLAMLDSGFWPIPEFTHPDWRIASHAATAESPVRHRRFQGPASRWPDSPPPSTHCWHGSMTSAIAAGSGIRSQGHFAGIAPGAKLHLVQVRAADGRIGDRQIAAGLRWLLENHERLEVRVVSLSVGGDRPLPTLNSPVNRAVRRLVRRGLIVIAAAGNAGQRRLVPPASAPEAITVGGLDDRNSLDPRLWRAWNSNYGPTVDGVAKPDLIAPSAWLPAPILPETDTAFEAEVLTRLWQLPLEALPSAIENGPPAVVKWAGRNPLRIRAWIARRIRTLRLVDAQHQYVDGTSFAAPLVAGTVVAMLEQDDRIDAVRAKRILQRTARPLPGVPSDRQGAGVLRSGAAVAYVRRARHFRSGGPSPHLDARSITFHWHGPDATRVRLVAEWLDHDPHRGRFVRIEGPVWRLSLPRPPDGRWRYRFLIDGETLRTDDENPEREPDGCGGWNSVLEVGAQR